MPRTWTERSSVGHRLALHRLLMFILVFHCPSLPTDILWSPVDPLHYKSIIHSTWAVITSAWFIQWPFLMDQVRTQPRWGVLLSENNERRWGGGYYAQSGLFSLYSSYEQWLPVSYFNIDNIIYFLSNESFDNILKYRFCVGWKVVRFFFMLNSRDVNSVKRLRSNFNKFIFIYWRIMHNLATSLTNRHQVLNNAVVSLM